MTELQKREFEIFKSFVDICEKLNLTYYMVCGSALGAAKYGGFIPWDDDIDVALRREDYRIFLSEAPKMLPPHIFLQNYKTDPAFPQIYCKLRDSRTTYIEKSVAHLPMNHGVFIDIFPLDGYPCERKAQRLLERKKKTYKRRLACVCRSKRSFFGKLLYWWNRLLGYHRKTAKTAEAYETMVAKYATKNSDVLCNHGNWQGDLDYLHEAQYGAGATANFEGVEVRIPEKTDEYLTQKYGEWHLDLPENKAKSHHLLTKVDLTRPYTHYFQ